MAFAKNTIRLGAAQAIFPQFDIKEQMLNGSPTGIYSATVKRVSGKHQLIEKGLTSLCTMLVAELDTELKKVGVIENE